MWGKISEDIVIHEYLNFKKNEKVKVADIYFGIVDADNENKVKTYIGRYLEAIKSTEIKYVSFNKFNTTLQLFG